MWIAIAILIHIVPHVKSSGNDPCLIRTSRFALVVAGIRMSSVRVGNPSASLESAGCKMEGSCVCIFGGMSSNRSKKWFPHFPWSNNNSPGPIYHHQ